MKTKKFLTNTFKLFTVGLCCITIAASAQNRGILPLTGMKYFSDGLLAREIDVKIDGSQLLSNRIPLNKEIIVELKQLTGLIAESQRVFVDADVSLISPKGELLSSQTNVLAQFKQTGLTLKDLSVLQVKFSISAASTKTYFNGYVKIRLYDLKGKNQMRFEMPVTFARPGERLQVSNAAKAIKSASPLNGVVCGLQTGNVKVMVDTSIKVAPKMAYTSLNFPNLKGSSITGIFEGKENFWVYDDELNEVKIPEILLKQVKGALENNSVDYTLKIPYRLKTMLAKYTVRFRWESPDKSQVIDVVVSI